MKKRQQSKKDRQAKEKPSHAMESVGDFFRTIKEEVLSTFTAGGKTKATDLLKEDHKRFKALIKKLKSAKENKIALVAVIEEEIKIHSQAEELIFYPEMKKVESEMIAEATEEHHQVDLLLAQLKEMTGEEGEAFTAKVAVLEENLEHHIKEEEEEMFPKAEKELKDQLEELGAEMEYFKGEWNARERKAA
jgi:hemerythrin-like domain-containing protein